MNVSMDVQIATLICLRHFNDGNSCVQLLNIFLLIGIPEWLTRTSINILGGELCKNYCKILQLR